MDKLEELVAVDMPVVERSIFEQGCVESQRPASNSSASKSVGKWGDAAAADGMNALALTCSLAN